MLKIALEILFLKFHSPSDFSTLGGSDEYPLMYDVIVLQNIFVTLSYILQRPLFELL